MRLYVTDIAKRDIGPKKKIHTWASCSLSLPPTRGFYFHFTTSDSPPRRPRRMARRSLRFLGAVVLIVAIYTVVSVLIQSARVVSATESLYSLLAKKESLHPQSQVCCPKNSNLSTKKFNFSLLCTSIVGCPRRSSKHACTAGWRHLSARSTRTTDGRFHSGCTRTARQHFHCARRRRTARRRRPPPGARARPDDASTAVARAARRLFHSGCTRTAGWRFHCARRTRTARRRLPPPGARARPGDVSTAVARGARRRFHCGRTRTVRWRLRTAKQCNCSPATRKSKGKIFTAIPQRSAAWFTNQIEDSPFVSSAGVAGISRPPSLPLSLPQLPNSRAAATTNSSTTNTVNGKQNK